MSSAPAFDGPDWGQNLMGHPDAAELKQRMDAMLGTALGAEVAQVVVGLPDWDSSGGVIVRSTLDLPLEDARRLVNQFTHYMECPVGAPGEKEALSDIMEAAAWLVINIESVMIAQGLWPERLAPDA